MRKFLAISWLIALALAMLTPGTELPEVDLFNFQDKVIHLLTFAVQGYLWSGIGIQKDQVFLKNPKIQRNFFLFGILIGVFLESLQQFIPNRSFEFMDMMANALGASLGLVGYLKWPFIKYILD